MIDEKTLESATDGVVVTNILLAAIENLDYKKFCDFVDDGNMFSNLLDMTTKDAVSESEFEKKKKELKAGVCMAGLPSAFVGLAEILKGIDDDDDSDEYDETDDEPVASFKTVAKIDKTKPEQKDEKRINLTGEPAIDAEIIFNMVKRHK